MSFPLVTPSPTHLERDCFVTFSLHGQNPILVLTRCITQGRPTRSVPMSFTETLCWLVDSPADLVFHQVSPYQSVQSGFLRELGSYTRSWGICKLCRASELVQDSGRLDLTPSLVGSLDCFEQFHRLENYFDAYIHNSRNIVHPPSKEGREWWTYSPCRPPGSLKLSPRSVIF